MVSIKLNKSAQVFTFDFIIGLIMFVIIMVIAGKQLINILPSNEYSQLYDENVYFSNTLLQPGHPYDWNTSNVLIPGIAENNRLDASKLSDFSTFTYDQSKSFFHITNEYVFYFKTDTAILPINGVCSHGYSLTVDLVTCEPDFSLLGYSNLVTSSRLVIYNSSILEMVLVSWN